MKGFTYQFQGALLCGMLALAPVAQAELAVIVNPGNSASSAKAKVIGRIFLGKTKSLPGGGKVAAVDQPDGSANKNNFYKGATGKDEGKLKSYWTKRIFTGKGTPLEVVGDDAAVMAWVASHADGIGYVDSSVVDGSVKKILSIP